MQSLLFCLASSKSMPWRAPHVFVVHLRVTLLCLLCLRGYLSLLRINLHVHEPSANIIPIAHMNKKKWLESCHRRHRCKCSLLPLTRGFFSFLIAASIVSRDVVIFISHFDALSADSERKPPQTNFIGPLAGTGGQHGFLLEFSETLHLLILSAYALIFTADLCRMLSSTLYRSSLSPRLSTFFLF